jgi:hypothetical protein
MSFVILTDKDYNGECFIAGSEGEVEVEDPFHDVPFIAEGCPESLVKPVFNTDDIKRWAGDFLDLQIRCLAAANAHAAELRQAVYTDLELAVAAYTRFCVMKLGLYDYSGDILSHHVRYCEVRKAAGEELALFRNHKWDEAAARILALLTEPLRAKIRACTTNVICCVAYLFRVRAHHYLDSMRDRYMTLWRRARYDEDCPYGSWKVLATVATHAIYPDVLDSFWQDCVANSRCAGTLVKRFECAPAGIAGVAAIRVGLNDITLVFPKIIHVLEAQVRELARIEGVILNERWAGSVNHRYYGAPRIAFREEAIAALAACIVASLHAFVPGSKMVDSSSLNRIASSAQITGAVLSGMLMTASRDERMVVGLLPDKT